MGTIRWREIITSIDWVILLSALLLSMTGLAMFFSATYTQGPVSPLFVRQGVVVVAGFAVAILLSQFPYHAIKRYAFIFYGLGIAALFTVEATGRIIRGTVSRLELFGFQLQPSEFIKIIIIIVLAAALGRVKHISFGTLIKTGILVGIPLVMVASEPDTGMAALYGALWLGNLLFWGLPWRYLVILGLLAGLGGFLAWHYVFLDYQKARLISFVNPSADPLGRGYNVSQSIVALGSGQVLGRGLGHGPQSQLKFLPERHTDFILASIGEELGFVGVSLVLLLYLVMLWRILRIARQTNDPFGRILVIGVFIALVSGLFVSAGMNMGLLPVTGIPLPLVSYGGSNLLATFILLGLVESVWVYSRFKRHAPLEISNILS